MNFNFKIFIKRVMEQPDNCKLFSCISRSTELLEHEYPMVRCQCKREINRNHIEYYRTMIKKDPENGGKIALDKIGLTWWCCRDSIMNVSIQAKSRTTNASNTLLPKEITIDSGTVIIKNQQNPFEPGETGKLPKRRYKLSSRSLATKGNAAEIALLGSNVESIYSDFNGVAGYLIFTLWTQNKFPKVSTSVAQELALIRFFSKEWKLEVSGDDISYTYLDFHTENIPVKDEKGNIIQSSEKTLEITKKVDVIRELLSLDFDNYISRVRDSANYILRITMDQMVRVLLLLPVTGKTLVIFLDEDEVEVQLYFSNFPIQRIVSKFKERDFTWIGKFFRLRVEFPFFENIQISLLRFRHRLPTMTNLAEMAVEILPQLTDPEQIKEIKEAIKPYVGLRKKTTQ